MPRVPNDPFRLEFVALANALGLGVVRGDLFGPQVDAQVIAPQLGGDDAADGPAGKWVDDEAARRAEPAVSQFRQDGVENAGPALLARHAAGNVASLNFLVDPVLGFDGPS